jgi:hypothetical protein
MAKVVEFPEQNAVFTGNGKNIVDLPCFMDGQMTIACWEPSKEDLANLVKTGKIYVGQMNYGEPLQPQALWFESPFFNGGEQCEAGEA